MSVEGPWWGNMSTIEETIKALSWRNGLAALKQISAENEKKNCKNYGFPSLGKKAISFRLRSSKGQKDVPCWDASGYRENILAVPGDVLIWLLLKKQPNFEERKSKAETSWGESIDVTCFQVVRLALVVTVIASPWPKPAKKSKISLVIGMGYQVVDGFEVEKTITTLNVWIRS